uniref:Uncharacterized protein n=1 Tax=Arundo donax TaxID=35708 RepID=A0A0A8Y6Y3_ARUDO
MAKRVTDVSPC